MKTVFKLLVCLGFLLLKGTNPLAAKSLHPMVAAVENVQLQQKNKDVVNSSALPALQKVSTTHQIEENVNFENEEEEQLVFDMLLTFLCVSLSLVVFAVEEQHFPHYPSQFLNSRDIYLRQRALLI